jgi:hypothetical protein
LLHQQASLPVFLGLMPRKKLHNLSFNWRRFPALKTGEAGPQILKKSECY